MNHKGECLEYTQLDANLFSIFLRDGEDGIIRFEPIPITAEILEANGWKKTGWGLKMETEEIYSEIKWGSEGYDIAVVHEKDSVDKTCRYVHELQQACRLCGLNEFADNFRISE